jgi:hypothetical protein
MERYQYESNKDDGQANAGSAEGSIPEEWDIDGTFLHWTSDFVVARLLLAVRRLVSLMVRGGLKVLLGVQEGLFI